MTHSAERTPGPWEISFEAPRWIIQHEFEVGKRAIAFLLGSYLECGANARLIAAAPELLEPAPDAADILEQYADFIRTVKADELDMHPYLPHIEQVAADLRAAIAKATGK